jgi:hypothetical protein
LPEKKKRSKSWLRIAKLFTVSNCSPGGVTIAPASRTKDPGFESRQGLRSSYIVMLLAKLKTHCLRKMNALKRASNYV